MSESLHCVFYHSLPQSGFENNNSKISANIHQILLRKAHLDVGHKEMCLDKASITGKNIYLTLKHGSSWFQEFYRFYLTLLNKPMRQCFYQNNFMLQKN